MSVQALGLGAALVAAVPDVPLAQARPVEEKPKKLGLDLRVTPPVSFAPARVRAIAELKLPEDRAAEFYCASVEWDWGDLTESEETTECEPYEPGVSEVKQRFTAEHTFQFGGRYRVQLRLRRNRKVLLSSATVITVRPGVRESPYGADPQP
jgi:hypothetical protein